MAEKKPAKTESKAGETARKKKSAKAGVPVFMIGSIVMAAVFLPSSVLLVIGMLPTLVALFAHPARARTRAVTVGALNLSGCVPFLLDLWTQGHSLDRALNIVSDPKAIIVMYAAAAVGYILDWCLSSMVAAILYQRGIARQEAIKKRQEELVARWGVEITGQVPLDHLGFAIAPPEGKRPPGG